MCHAEGAGAGGSSIVSFVHGYGSARSDSLDAFSSPSVKKVAEWTMEV